MLQQTLDEEGATDKRLTDIADEINRAAAEPETEATRPAARLRYVDVNDMDGERYEYRDYKIRDAAGEGIGSVDGFLVDASGRPYYVVVDSGGLFVGRRYIVPIGKATLDRSGRAFSIGLDKDTLKRYPEFHRDAFIAMSDDEARRYEWRVLEAIDPAAARKTPRTWDYDQFDYYRRPDWADEAWRGDIGAAQRTRDRQDVSTPSASKRRDRDASVTVPDRDEERVLAREEQIVTPDEDLDREPPRERITGTERDQPKRRGE
jgi:hypothetical protein